VYYRWELQQFFRKFSLDGLPIEGEDCVTSRKTAVQTFPENVIGYATLAVAQHHFVLAVVEGKG